MSTAGPDHPGDLYRLVAPAEAREALVVSHAGAAGDGRSATGVLYLAESFVLRLHDGGATVTVTGGGGEAVERAEGPWRDAAAAAMAAATRRVRASLPVRYLDWLAARTALPREELIRDAPALESVDAVLALLVERFGPVMSPPRVEVVAGDDVIATRLYDAFDLSTGLERPRGSFVRTVRLPGGFGLGPLPGERAWLTPTPGTVRRAYRVLDEYCRARLDLPPRTDDEETP